MLVTSPVSWQRLSLESPARSLAFCFCFFAVPFLGPSGLCGVSEDMDSTNSLRILSSLCRPLPLSVTPTLRLARVWVRPDLFGPAPFARSSRSKAALVRKVLRPGREFAP